MAHTVRVFPSLDALSLTFAELLVKDLDRIGPDEYYSIALSGGTTPVFLFKYLSENFVDRISWDQLLVFWVDERCVPPEDNESNYKMAFEHLLQNVPLPDTNVFRIRGEANPLLEAKQYSELVSENIPEYNDVPQFDLVLLGLGDDGHTASVFPENVNLFNSSNIYDVSVKPENKQRRITATGKLINNASKVVFLVTGKKKADIVSQIIHKKSGYEKYPASRVNPVSGQLTWMLDADAGSLLNNQ